MTKEAEIIKSNLSSYPFIEKFLGNIIEQRLAVKCYEYGMLTAQLLGGGPSEPDLERLEHALQLSEANCTDFKLIFLERKLSAEDMIIDTEIINLLAEVKAVELLHNWGFTEITKIKREKGSKTVDFSCKRKGQDYAVEVTRLGLAKSDRKKPKFDKSSPSLQIIGSKEQENRIEEDIYDEVTDKYPQIREFCQAKGRNWKGILIISNGRDYFAMGRYENKLYELHPRKVAQAIKQGWNSLKEEQGYAYLSHLVITMGKDLQKVITYPNLLGQGA